MRDLVDELQEHFQKQLGPPEAQHINAAFDEWMDARGEELIDCEREWPALIGFAAGYLLRQKEEEVHMRE